MYWCNTHEPHATIKPGKKGYTIALRTCRNAKELSETGSNILYSDFSSAIPTCQEENFSFIDNLPSK